MKLSAHTSIIRHSIVHPMKCPVCPYFLVSPKCPRPNEYTLVNLPIPLFLCVVVHHCDACPLSLSDCSGLWYATPTEIGYAHCSVTPLLEILYGGSTTRRLRINVPMLQVQHGVQCRFQSMSAITYQLHDTFCVLALHSIA